MIIRIVLVGCVLALLWLAVRWLAGARPGQVAQALRRLGLAALVALGLWLVLTGKLAGIVAVAAGLTPWIFRALRLHALWRALRRWVPRTPAARSTAMSREEAWDVLGLAPGAGAEEIKAAHRRLMRQAHPDRGGSTWVAARINQARDLLLGDR